jgi:uncharacterized protein (DUF1778 family)
MGANMENIAEHNERINFRLPTKNKEIIERAAVVKGMTLTQFAISTLVKEAREVLKSDHVLVLSDEDRDQFLAALDNPPAPNAKLLKAAKAYKTAKANGRLHSA